ncbi:hypothetical protein HDA40_008138 [Hamadaea flava]|uniref:RING-type E3 ubiquitin transferase n=1 Tax=Hamadaea flava TaxID=1742688 RepID=A0ABV8LMA2_9ACTN|nr:hypothetical protein [Hamadaea flava]MCP2329631.1 hypothetical protein [Hamadaea flava]
MSLGQLTTWASSGVTGLLIGSVLGLTLSVIFEDRLKRSLARTRRRLHAIRRGQRTGRSDFSFGGLSSSCLIVEGDGTFAIADEAVYILVCQEPVSLPPEIRKWIPEIAAEQEIKRQAGLPHHFNGQVYAVESLTSSRIPGTEEPEVHLRLRVSDYYSFLATQDLDRRFPDGSTLRSRYIDPVGPRAAPVFMSLSLGTSVVVVTKDDRILMCQRGESAGSRPLFWGVSADEGLSVSLDGAGQHAPRLYNVARRGMIEELSVEDHEYRLTLLAFTIDTLQHQWDSVFIAYLHELDSHDLAERLDRGAKDHSEINAYEFVPFRVDAVLSALSSSPNGTPRNWTPIAGVAFYLALIHDQGRASIERQGRRFAKQRRSRTLKHS